MNDRLDGLEDKLNEMLVKKAPFALPKNAKEWIAKYGPWIGLIFGVIGLLAALSLWNFAHTAESAIDYANSIAKAYGTPKVADRLTFWFYPALIVSIIQSIIAIVAFSGLKARSKAKGWNLLYYSALLSVVYGVFNAIYYSSVASLIGNLFGSLIGLYILFQIRELYNGNKHVDSSNSETTS